MDRQVVAGKLKGLYALTDRVLTPRELLTRKVREALLGGARIIQLRDKASTDEELVPVSLELKDLCEGFGRLFIVNDRVSLAKKVKAHGVHIGKDDISLERAREELGDKAIIGVSCYNSLELAMKYERMGADYVAFGSFFPSPTKPGAVRADTGLLKKARGRLNVPICAIGGINHENAGLLVENGVDMVAVVSALWKSKDIKKGAREISSIFERKRRARHEG